MSERRVPGWLKDEHGAYVKVPAESKPAESVTLPTPYNEPLRHDIDLDDLISRCRLVLWREVHNLQIASAGGAKLTKDQAIELRENMKLLVELKKKEKDYLDSLPDEELAALGKAKNANVSVDGSGRTRNRPPRKAKKPTEVI